MVFQIRRIDVPGPSRILEVGKHNIGPGQFLLEVKQIFLSHHAINCKDHTNLLSDPRIEPETSSTAVAYATPAAPRQFVFREESDLEIPLNHAQLVVTEEVVSLKTLNKNPCYYVKTKTIRREVLRQSEAYTFSSGDRFGLTPDSHWYEITTFSGQDTFPNPLKSRSTGKDGNQIESGGCKNIIPVSDTDDDSVKLSGSIDDSNQPDSTTSLKEEPEASGYKPAENTLAISTAIKRAQHSKDSSTIDIKKAKTGPSQGSQDAQTEPKKDNDCVCCP